MTLPERLEFYASEEGAQEYLEEYQKLHRRWSDRREHRLLRAYFRRIGPIENALDLPSGWGRYLPFLQSQGAKVIEADYSGEMLRLSRDLAGERSAWGAFRAFGHRIPLADRTVDLVFSMRLNHHLVESEVRREHLREILRVARRWAIFSYFDANSLKSWSRRLRRRFGSRKRLKNTLSRREVRELVAAAGFELCSDPMLFLVGSGHRLVLARRVQPTD